MFGEWKSIRKGTMRGTSEKFFNKTILESKKEIKEAIDNLDAFFFVGVRDGGAGVCGAQTAASGVYEERYQVAMMLAVVEWLKEECERLNPHDAMIVRKELAGLFGEGVKDGG